VGEWIEPGFVDWALLDLGLSSPQLDQAERGFSFQEDGPLDMRMDRRQETTASDLLATATAVELARIFWEFGGEPEGRRLAKVIVEERGYRPLKSTGQLAGLVERIKPRHGQRTHPATRVFQALRMAVNDEVGELGRGLAAVWRSLKVNGRLVVITFHSGEDRVVKDFGKQGALPYTYPGAVDVPAMRQPREPELKIVTRKAVAPSAEEQAANPRSRSAQMRVFEKLRHE
jgi:16S rRNA (cytosine1402-N4)-methyltransferase